MSAIPLLFRADEDADALAVALKRCGVRIEKHSLASDAPVPASDLYIVADRPGVPAARAWRGRGDRQQLRRTVVCSEMMRGRDVVDLDTLGLRYACDTRPNLNALLRLVGLLNAEAITEAKTRVEEAQQLASSILHSTTSAFGLFPTLQSYDAGFYHGLCEEFSKRVAVTPLMLLLDAISANQDSTIQHCATVSTVAMAFGGVLGLGPADMERLFLAAFFHDIGKSAVPAYLIDKPDRLTPEEITYVRAHVTAGYDILRRFPETAGEIADVALHHHEMLDGSGYPNGLAGNEISDLIRLVTICDVFTALIEKRAYKAPMAPAKAYAILRDMGPKLDQDLVRVFEAVIETLG